MEDCENGWHCALSFSACLPRSLRYWEYWLTPVVGNGEKRWVSCQLTERIVGIYIGRQSKQLVRYQTVVYVLCLQLEHDRRSRSHCH